MQVLEHDMDEEEVRDVLLEAMQNMIDAPETDEESGLKGASGSSAGGFFARKLKRKGGAAKLSNEELESAAHWLVERFGQEDDDDSNEEDATHHHNATHDTSGDGEDEVGLPHALYSCSLNQAVWRSLRCPVKNTCKRFQGRSAWCLCSVYVKSPATTGCCARSDYTLE